VAKSSCPIVCYEVVRSMKGTIMSLLALRGSGLHIIILTLLLDNVHKEETGRENGVRGREKDDREEGREGRGGEG